MPSPPEQGPEKKKRRQNVACDSCRLRRVKCDMLSLLTPPDADPTKAVPPLHVLVRDHPEVSCSNCISKGIKCTTNQIVNPAKPNKGGKRIEEAKKMYGSGLEASSASASGSAEGTPHFASQVGGGLSHSDRSSLDRGDSGLGIGSSSGSAQQGSSSNAADIGGISGGGFFGEQFSYASLTPNVAPAAMYINPESTGGHFLAASWGAAGFTPTTFPYENTYLDSSRISGVSSPLPTADTSLQATWEALINPALSTVVPTSLPPPPRTSSSVLLSAENLGAPSSLNLFETDPAKFPQIAMDRVFDPRSDRFVSRSAGSGSLSASVSPAPRPSPRPEMTTLRAMAEAQSPEHSIERDGSGPLVSSSRRKRQHDDDEDVVEIIRINDPVEQDPWRIWAPPDAVVRWSQAEQVGERLADRALGLELSRHLVKVFFQAVHLNLPAISPEAFYMEWQRAGERSDRLTPAQEVLCVVMEAWAARFSDHPVASTHRKLIRSPKMVPGSQARQHWGRARLKVCLALAERARKLIDHYGILRKPSVTGAQALTLYSQLCHMSDTKDSALSNVLETQMIHSIIIEQMKHLELMWDSSGQIPVEPSEIPISIGQQRMKQRRLFWTMIVSDAFWAAGSGCEPKVPDEEIEASAAWLLRVEDGLPPSTFKALSFFTSTYHRLAVIARTVARKLAVPAKRPGRVDVAQFCNTCRAVWRDVKDVYRDLNTRVVELLASCAHELLGFSPIHYLSALRQSCPFIVLIMQQLIHDQLAFRKTLSEAYLQSDARPSHTRPELEQVAELEELNVQSIDLVLSLTRSQTYMFEETGLVQSASVMIRVLLAIAQFLSEIPTNEQGYPSNTAGGSGWTWETKQKEVGYCTAALAQLGWAWADVGDVLEQVMLTMERLTPSPEVLAAYVAKTNPDGFDHVALQVQRDRERDAKAVASATTFWPPLSVPDIVADWSRNTAKSLSPPDTFEARYASAQNDAAAAAASSVKERIANALSTEQVARFFDPTLATNTLSDPATNHFYAQGPYVPVSKSRVTPSTVSDTTSPGETGDTSTKGDSRPLILTPGMMWDLDMPPIDAAAEATGPGSSSRPSNLNSGPLGGHAVNPSMISTSGVGLSAEMETFLENLVNGGGFGAN